MRRSRPSRRRVGGLSNAASALQVMSLPTSRIQTAISSSCNPHRGADLLGGSRNISAPHGALAGPRPNRHSVRVTDPNVLAFVVVSGPPGSGKSSLASVLSKRFGLPLFSKDTIKEALMSALGAPHIEASRRL